MAPLGGDAADWTHYRGPTHDGVSTERINLHWAGSVTNPVWRVALTNGLGSVTVRGGRVFTPVAGDLDGEGFPHKEFCVAFSATDGTWLWSTEVEHRPLPDYLYPNGGVGWDDGPRSTPVAVDDSLFVLTSYLKLYRLNATNGAIVWSTNLMAGFGGSVIGWQNAASPLVEGGLVFVNANAGAQRLMAFNATNGALVWRAHNEPMTHATPVLATVHGTRQLIYASQSGLVAVQPQTGTLLWKATHPFTYTTSIGTSPTVHDDFVFLTANYSMRAYAVQLVLSNTVFVPQLRWSNTVQLSHWSTPVAHVGHLYGMFYPNDANGQLRCVDLATGTTRWATNGFGRSSLLRVGTNLLCLTERGAVVLVAAHTNAHRELGRFQAIPDYHPDTNKCWNAMALSDGQLYVRSTARLARFDLAQLDLRLDPPRWTAANRAELTIRTATGAPLASNRLAALEVRATTNLDAAPGLWSKLTNTPLWSNGVVRVPDVDASPPRRFFIVSEPQ